MEYRIGTMNEAYTVGRTELIKWLNDLLETKYSKVEEVANGAAFCQIMDACFPGKVNLSRVNFNAYLPHEITQNYKTLQKIFATCGVQKYVDSEVLSRGRFIENLEFLQWMKCYYETNGSSTPLADYHGRERRRHFGIAEPRCSNAAPSVSTPVTRTKAATSTVTPATRTAATSAVRNPAVAKTTTTRTVRTPAKPRVLHFAPSPAPSSSSTTTTASSLPSSTLPQTISATEEEPQHAPAEKRRREVNPGETVNWEVQGLLTALEQTEKRVSELEERLKNAERICTDVLAKKYSFDETEDPACVVAGRVLDSLFTVQKP